MLVGPTGLRFASPHYDSFVHTPYVGFRESANVTSEELLNLSIIESSNVSTDGMSLLISCVDHKKVRVSFCVQSNCLLTVWLYP